MGGGGKESLADAARYRHPTPGWRGCCVEFLVGARWWTSLRRRLVARFPMPALVSDVEDVAYLNWWVDPAALPPAPHGYRYWAREGRTPFTILSYRHGHFGPAFAGRMRRLFPSPLQSNWRWYLQRDGAKADEVPTVLFARNVMDSLLHVVGARIWSDAMQPQAAMKFVHGWREGVLETRIDPGGGGSPSMDSTLALSRGGCAQDEWWRRRFSSRNDAIRFLACQDEALAIAPDGREALTRIALPVDLASVQSLDCLSVHCPFLETMRADPTEPFCFLLPQVPFRVVSERLL